MILEGAFELRMARECKRLKEKEQFHFEIWETAIKEWEDAIVDGRNDQDVEDAWQKAEMKKMVWKVVKNEAEAATQGIAFLVMEALKKGRCTEEAEENV